ncbi:MAG: FHA domain-containing protein [Armatimonadetes bacterium]|nr:FHA domain-containing protein [Armatimonadota bacterium]
MLDPLAAAGSPGAPPALDAGAYSEATQQAISITCAVCQTPNPPGERWCQDCGFLLGSTVSEGEAAPDTAALPRLVATDAGDAFFLNPGTNLVGREGADVLLTDPAVSRRHAQIVLEDAAAWVEDLGSTNGTEVAERRLAAGERATLYDGDEVRFGSVTLTALLPGYGPRPAEATQGIAPEALAEEVVDRGPVWGVLVGSDGTEYPLYEGVNTLGRRRQNQIVLSGDAYVSGQHAEIRCHAADCFLVDLGSTNGTVVRGERLVPHAPVLLSDGEGLRVGQTVLTLRYAPEGGATALSQPPIDTSSAPQASTPDEFPAQEPQP